MRSLLVFSGAMAGGGDHTIGFLYVDLLSLSELAEVVLLGDVGVGLTHALLGCEVALGPRSSS